MEVKAEHMRQKPAPCLSIFALKCDSVFLLTSSLSLPKSPAVFLSGLLEVGAAATQLGYLCHRYRALIGLESIACLTLKMFLKPCFMGETSLEFYWIIIFLDSVDGIQSCC